MAVTVDEPPGAEQAVPIEPDDPPRAGPGDPVTLRGARNPNSVHCVENGFRHTATDGHRYDPAHHPHPIYPIDGSSYEQ
ncbi:hypothetical protein GCM10010232_16880 [Streptomyces amakusaensis]